MDSKGEPPQGDEHARCRIILARMSRLVLDFGGSECFCHPETVERTGRYCEVCELRDWAKVFA